MAQLKSGVVAFFAFQSIFVSAIAFIWANIPKQTEIKDPGENYTGLFKCESTDNRYPGVSASVYQSGKKILANINDNYQPPQSQMPCQLEPLESMNQIRCKGGWTSRIDSEHFRHAELLIFDPAPTRAPASEGESRQTSGVYTSNTYYLLVPLTCKAQES